MGEETGSKSAKFNWTVPTELYSSWRCISQTASPEKWRDTIFKDVVNYLGPLIFISIIGKFVPLPPTVFQLQSRALNDCRSYVNGRPLSVRMLPSGRQRSFLPIVVHWFERRVCRTWRALTSENGSTVGARLCACVVLPVPASPDAGSILPEFVGRESTETASFDSYPGLEVISAFRLRPEATEAAIICTDNFIFGDVLRSID